MMGHSLKRAAAVSLLLVMALLPACSDEATEDGPTTTNRTSEEVAALLVAPEALGEGWSTLVAQGDMDFEGGVVTDENRDTLPRMELCEKADAASTSAANTLAWQAFRQLNLDTGMQPTKPSPGKRPQHHLVFVQEFLYSADEPAVAAAYDDLERGMTACATAQTTSPDGEEITSQPLEVPAVGDTAAGLRYTVQEPGGGGGAEWALRNVVFRDGDLLVSLLVAEIATPKVTRVMDDAAFEEVLDAVATALR